MDRSDGGGRLVAYHLRRVEARGMEDCFIACVDGLKGLPEAIERSFHMQLCIVPRCARACGSGGRPARNGAERRGRSRGQAFERWTRSTRLSLRSSVWRLSRLCACDPQGGTNAIESLTTACARSSRGGALSPTTRGAQAALPGPARSVEEMEAAIGTGGRSTSSSYSMETESP